MSPIRPLGRQVQKLAWALPVAVAAVASVGLLRLGRQFPAAAASPALLGPFILPVLGLALEAGALVALSWAHLRTLIGLEDLASSARIRATLPLLASFVLVLGAAELVPRGTERPGAFANELLETARTSCSGAKPVLVPLLGLQVNCLDAGRFEGFVPGVRAVHVAMQQLRFSDDLRRVEIAGLQLSAERSLRVQLRAGSARVVGLAPWSRSPRFSAGLRVAILGALGFGLWLPACFVFSRRWLSSLQAGSLTSQPRPWAIDLFGNLLLVAPGVVIALGFVLLDQERALPAAYAGVSAFGLATLGLVGLVARRAPRIFASFRGS